jgi:hypothetical protein
MAGTTFGIIMIVIAAVTGLVALEVLVLAADRSPYFKHPHPDRIWSKVRGGVHLGDPRSCEAPFDEPVGPGGEQPGQPAAEREDGTARLARSCPGSPPA